MRKTCRMTSIKPIIAIIIYFFITAGFVLLSKCYDVDSRQVIELLCYTSIFCAFVFLFFRELTEDAKKIRFRQIEKLIVFFTCTIVLRLLVMAILVSNFGTSTNQEHLNTLCADYPIWVYLLAYLMVPVYEELVFRYAIMKLLDPKRALSIIVSVVIFSVLHMRPADFLDLNLIAYIIIYFGSGFCMAYIYHRTENIILPIIFHVLLNIF